MRVALVDTICDPARPGESGHSDIVWNIAEQLRALGDEVYIVAPYAPNVGPRLDVAVHRFKLPRGAYRNVFGHTRVALAALPVLRSIDQADIVHAFDSFSAGIISSLLPRASVVLTAPGSIYERIDAGNPPIDLASALAYKAVSRAAAAHCRALIATSQYMRRWWIRGGTSADKVRFLPLGVDGRLFGATCRPALKRRDPTRLKRLLCVGRLVPENSLDYLLQATHLLCARAREFDLVVVGDGPEKERLKAMARELQIDARVHWEGGVELAHLPNLFTSSDAFVFTRVCGATPRVVLQAMASATPIVAFGCGGLTDYLADGDTALLAPPGDVRQLAGKLEELLLHPARGEMLGRRAAAYARSELTWTAVVARMRAEIYETVLATEDRVVGQPIIMQPRP